MGEYAEMLLDGSCDEWTGEYIGPAVGYPRSLDPDHYSNKKRWPNLKNDNPGYSRNALQGLRKYARKHGVGKTDVAIKRFAKEVLHRVDADTAAIEKTATFISNHHFGHYMGWIKGNYTTNKTQ